MKYIYPIIISFLFNQTIEVGHTLYPDEFIEINNIEIEQNSEAIAHFYMDTNTDWSQNGSESSTLTLYINSIDSITSINSIDLISLIDSINSVDVERAVNRQPGYRSRHS